MNWICFRSVAYSQHENRRTNRDCVSRTRRAAASRAIKSVIPVGEAWIRAIDEGIADANPYDGITPGQIDLWAADHYHASSAGYYLEALMVFGDVAGRDPRSLGEGECAAFELGIRPATAKALQRVAFEQLAAAKRKLARGRGG